MVVKMGVALLTEGVDRNLNLRSEGEGCRVSPSSRRAWIEIRKAVTTACCLSVALLTEGVDRNAAPLATMNETACRPPHGGRG